jgi:hypothetical protein
MIQYLLVYTQIPLPLFITKVYPQVSELNTRAKNGKQNSFLPLGSVASPSSESVY